MASPPLPTERVSVNDVEVVEEGKVAERSTVTCVSAVIALLSTVDVLGVDVKVSA